MFGMSFGEILLIFLLILIVFGPKELPIIATNLGRFFIKIQTFYHSIKHELYSKSGLQEITNAKTDLDNWYQDFKTQISSKNNIEYNTTYDDDLMYKIPLYYQPELDFDREPELFDEITH